MFRKLLLFFVSISFHLPIRIIYKYPFLCVCPFCFVLLWNLPKQLRWYGLRTNQIRESRKKPQESSAYSPLPKSMLLFAFPIYNKLDKYIFLHSMAASTGSFVVNMFILWFVLFSFRIASMCKFYSLSVLCRYVNFSQPIQFQQTTKIETFY